MEEKRAHERINDLTGKFLALEETFTGHIKSHETLEAALAKNTEMTQTIADNTTELVQLVKGAKGLRALIVWATPVVIAAAAVWAFMSGGKP